MNYDEALAYIHSYLRKGAAPGLFRIRELLKRIGNPEKKLKFVHIAGTNGKGSTASMLASILQQAGYRTGLYTSPFIARFNERIQVNGRMISDDELAQVVAFVRPHAEAMSEPPTEFELVTAIAFEYFARQECDILSLETGMGGLVDPTNIISCPEAAVICNIGFDHTAFLGDTLEKIAAAKAGIIKSGGDAVIYPCGENVDNIFAETCKNVGARLHKAEFETIQLISSSFEGQIFHCGKRKDLFLPLLGSHQLKNAAVVLAAVDVLIEKGWNISEENLRQGLVQTFWPGRFELLRKDPVLIVDGGHNPQCMEALVQNIREYLPGMPITALIGVMADKDYLDMFRMVEPYISQFVTVTPDNPRALNAESLAQSLAVFGKPTTPCQSVEAGVREAIAQTGRDGAVLAFGSLFMVGDIRKAGKQA